MFHSIKKSIICLVCIGKACTFAAALREKLTTRFTIYSFTIYHLKERKCGNKKTLVLFLKRLGSLEKRITFAAAYNGKGFTKRTGIN